MSFGIPFVCRVFLVVTFHSGGVRSFPAAQIQVLTCAEATEAIAGISDNFGTSKTLVVKNLTLILTFSNPPKI